MLRVAVFERDGLKLWYRLSGSGPAVVLHTGGGGDSDMFDAAGYVDALVRDGYRAVCFDHRGHGRSEKPLRREQHRTREYVEDVIGLLDTLGLGAAAIVGYSQGMQVAIALAATHPQRVAAVVGIGTVGTPGDSTDWRAVAAASTRTHGMAAAMNAIAEQEIETPPAWLLENLSSTDPEVFALLLEAALDDERTLWDYFPSVRSPTLLLVGEHEDDQEGAEPGLATRNARRAAGLMPNAEARTLPALAHLAAFWRSDLTLPVILRFLHEEYPAPITTPR